MDDLTRQKIPIIIKEHILQTKIGYVIDALLLEKRKCNPIVLDRDNGETGTSVYVKRTSYEPISDIRISGKTQEIRANTNGVVRRL
jgi:hypothetical protein